MQFKQLLLPLLVVLFGSPSQVAAEESTEAWKQVGAIAGVMVAISTILVGGQLLVMQRIGNLRNEVRSLGTQANTYTEQHKAESLSEADMEETVKIYLESLETDLNLNDDIIAKNKGLTEEQYRQSAISRGDFNQKMSAFTNLAKADPAAWATQGAALKEQTLQYQSDVAAKEKSWNAEVAQDKQTKLTKTDKTAQRNRGAVDEWQDGVPWQAKPGEDAETASNTATKAPTVVDEHEANVKETTKEQEEQKKVADGRDELKAAAAETVKVPDAASRPASQHSGETTAVGSTSREGEAPKVEVRLAPVAA
jgi:hypothetical protein